MLRKSVCLAPLVGLLVALLAASNIAPAAAASEPVTGTATTSGGNGFTTVDFTYSSPGLLGTGTMHTDFTFAGSTTTGTFVLTRSDGSTLTGPETSTVLLQASGWDVEIHFVVTSGTGALAGVTGEIVLTGVSHGPGLIGEVFTMTGTLTTPTVTPTDKAQCKDGGWQDLADDHGEPFPNQGRCVGYVAASR